MKIVSYNVNGIRAAQRKGLLKWLKAADPDVFCIQELKAKESQIDVEAFRQMGYHDVWFPAARAGYSGVAILSKQIPDRIHCGVGIPDYDREGRLIRADLGDLTIISVYHPSGSNTERVAFKLQWMEDFARYIAELRKDRPNVVICGDFNICHTVTDIHDPVRLQHVSGFLPAERDWMTRFLRSGLTDTFRYFNRDPYHYTWWSYMARTRLRNKGWRIDYIITTQNLDPRLRRAAILSEAHHSDHCPVLLELA